MLPLLLTLTVNVAIISLVIAALKFTGKVDINLKWSFFLLALLVSNALAETVFSQIIPVKLVISNPSFNWGGKILAILLSAGALFATSRVKSDFSPADAGLVFKQEFGSVKPALIALGFFVLLQIIITYMTGGSDGYNTETLWFQALMPGLDEELFFRGLLLYFASLAITSARANIFGAKINVAGTALAAYFGIIHGSAFDGLEWHIDPLIIMITGLYGLIILWFRERTGSLVFPIIAHNVINFVGQFVPAPG
jgi:uncharacterized protein